MPRNHRRLWLALYVVLLAACAPLTVKPAGTTTPGSATRSFTAATPATAATLPTLTAIPPTSVPLPGEQDLAQLKDQVLQQLIGDQTAAPDQPLDVSVLPLTTTGELSPLFAANSTGSILSLLPDGRHVLAFYTFADGRWDKVQRVSLNSSDYVNAASVQQVSIEPNHIWLEVQRSAGAHSGCYDLIALDPISRSVSQQITSCNSSPGAGYTADINGDGQLGSQVRSGRSPFLARLGHLFA